MIVIKLELHGWTHWRSIGYVEQLHIDIRQSEKLCHILKSKGGLVTTKNVTMEEVVALFLHTLGHDLKNRIIQVLFAPGETVSRQFHIVLGFLLKLEKYYIKKVDHSTRFVDDSKLKYFEVIKSNPNYIYLKILILPLFNKTNI